MIKPVLFRLAVCFMFVVVLMSFFQTESERFGIRSSTAQVDGVSSPAMSCQYHGETLPLSLDTITIFDRIRWSAQAIVAPEGLDDVLTVYVYPGTDPGLTDFFTKDETRSFSTWYVGRADEGKSGWTIDPLDADEVGDCLQGIAADSQGELWKTCFDIDESGGRQGVVSNRSFSGIRATAKLWGSISSWDEAHKQKNGIPMNTVGVLSDSDTLETAR